ncbi:hypothetical protein ABT075_00775 [Streptomyces sp. NPDC002677]|uniref:hypothetical protein n=1 Tax=Streptomyces sp. NPDC002677 TaxID=3154774 RepID=UPI00332A506D
MTAEHEAHEMYDGTDALMAAITDEELPDEARADAAFMAEHREAEADVTLLRRQLATIGDALAEEPRPHRRPAPARAHRTRRPVRGFAFGGLAVAAVAGVLSGMIWLLGQTGGVNSMSGGSSEDSGAKAAGSAAAGSPLFGPGYLACTRLIAEGEVTRVQRVPGGSGQERITLHVTRSYKPEEGKPEEGKPEKGKKEITFLADEDAVHKALHKGDHVLVALAEDSAVPDHVVVGEKSIARERAGLAGALSESRYTTCAPE